MLLKESIEKSMVCKENRNTHTFSSKVPNVVDPTSAEG